MLVLIMEVRTALDLQMQRAVVRRSQGPQWLVESRIWKVSTGNCLPQTPALATQKHTMFWRWRTS